MNKLFSVSKVPKSLSKEEIQKILSEFNAIAGEKAYHEILRDSIKIKRNMDFNNALTEKNFAEKQKAEERRAKITMSKGASSGASNGASSGTNKNPSAMQTDER